MFPLKLSIAFFVAAVVAVCAAEDFQETVIYLSYSRGMPKRGGMFLKGGTTHEEDCKASTEPNTAECRVPIRTEVDGPTKYLTWNGFGDSMVESELGLPLQLTKPEDRHENWELPGRHNGEDDIWMARVYMDCSALTNGLFDVITWPEDEWYEDDLMSRQCQGGVDHGITRFTHILQCGHVNTINFNFPACSVRTFEEAGAVGK